MRPLLPGQAALLELFPPGSGIRWAFRDIEAYTAASPFSTLTEADKLFGTLQSLQRLGYVHELFGCLWVEGPQPPAREDPTP